MSFTSFKRIAYNQQRSASQGAAITLVSTAGEYRAIFECAKHCAEALGDRELKDLGDGILEVIPAYHIPVEDLFSALTKLTQRFSVALVEYAHTRNGAQFVCLWRINSAIAQAPIPQPASKNLDDY